MASKSLTDPRWHKSSESGDSNCVEVNDEGSDTVLVRSSLSPDGPMLEFSRDEWSAFLVGVKADEFG